MAHRGEARAFFSEYKSEVVEENFYKLSTPFTDLEVYLYLTGEGIEDSLCGLSYILGKYHFLKNVLNLGICGLLRKDGPWEINDRVEIKTVYADATESLNSKHREASSSGRVNFKSFPLRSQKQYETYDLITTHQRVLSRDQADFLDNFAPLVDRELWAQAYACHKFDIPLSSIKVISDYADGEICEQVKEESIIWSDLLLRSFIEIFENPTHEESKIKDDNQNLHQFLGKDIQFFHLTLSQERNLRRLLHSLQIKGADFTELKRRINWSELTQLKLRPKDKTKELILLLTEQLNPMDARLRDKLKTLTYPLEKRGAKIKHDQDYEKDRIHLSVTLQRKDDFEFLADALKRFPVEKWKSLIRGEDV